MNLIDKYKTTELSKCQKKWVPKGNIVQYFKSTVLKNKDSVNKTGIKKKDLSNILLFLIK